MLAAAAAWDGLGYQLGLTTAAYQSLLAELTGGPWLGPASLAMLNAATPYVAWLGATADQAEQAAAQAKAAVTAYETAFAMTVPPPVVAANRIQLMTLVATNFFGQNAPAIAATEAHYGEMWAQDATTMYSYADSSAIASRVTPFTLPPQTTSAAGLSGQAAAVGQTAGGSAGTALTPPLSTSGPVMSVPVGVTAISQGPNLLLDYPGAGGSSADSLSVWLGDGGDTLQGAVAALGTGAQAASGTANALGPAASAVSGAGGELSVAATLSNAVRIGGLSVPATFPGAVPAAGSAVRTVGVAMLAAEEAIGGMPGIPGAPGALLAGSGSQGMRFVPRYGYRHKVMARPAGGG